MFHKKILITGASGFIGSFLVEEALRSGYIVYAGLRPGSSRNFLPQKELRFIQLDLASRELLERQLRHFNQLEGGFDYIIHNAGITHSRRKQDFQLVNDRYTRHLVDAVAATGRLPEKFIFISSLAAGGPGDPLHYKPIRIADPEHPLSAYGRSKLSAEKYIKSQPDLPYIIVRPTAVYGPRDRDFLKYFRLLGKGIEPYIGRGPQMISLIYVKDLARAVCRLLESGRPRASYLVSDGMAYKKEDPIRCIRKILDRPTIKIRVPLALSRPVVWFTEKISSLFGRMPFLHSEKLTEMAAPNWLCDSQELWKELGIQPDYMLEGGLMETTRWYREKGWIGLA